MSIKEKLLALGGVLVSQDDKKETGMYVCGALIIKFLDLNDSDIDDWERELLNKSIAFYDAYSDSFYSNSPIILTVFRKKGFTCKTVFK